MSWQQRVQPFAAPLVAGIVIFGGWELTLAILGPEGFVLPPPSDIIGAMADNSDDIRAAARNTGWVIVSGLAAGVVVGVIAAVLVTRFRTANEVITPLAVAVNAIPIIALAPIFNAWFGITSALSNQAVVVVVVFFPVFLNTARGLLEVEPSQIELMRSYGASDLSVLRQVRIPNAIPFFLTSLRLAAPLSVIAAIVAEYFGGPQDRLGPVITQNASFARYAEAWAAIVVASVVGLALFALAVGFERVAMPWRRPVDGQ